MANIAGGPAHVATIALATYIIINIKELYVKKVILNHEYLKYR